MLHDEKIDLGFGLPKVFCQRWHRAAALDDLDSALNLDRYFDIQLQDVQYPPELVDQDL
jgi:hypothetical protein